MQPRQWQNLKEVYGLQLSALAPMTWGILKSRVITVVDRMIASPHKWVQVLVLGSCLWACYVTQQKGTMVANGFKGANRLTLNRRLF